MNEKQRVNRRVMAACLQMNQVRGDSTTSIELNYSIEIPSNQKTRST